MASHIKAERIPDTNGYRAVTVYHGHRLECGHKHLTTSSARACLDVVDQALAIRDAEAATLQVGALAAVVVAAKRDRDVAYGRWMSLAGTGASEDEVADARSVKIAAQRHLDQVLAAWLTLLGLSLAEQDRALAWATQYANAGTVAHVAPF